MAHRAVAIEIWPSLSGQKDHEGRLVLDANALAPSARADLEPFGACLTPCDWCWQLRC